MGLVATVVSLHGKDDTEHLKVTQLTLVVIFFETCRKLLCCCQFQCRTGPHQRRRGNRVSPGDHDCNTLWHQQVRENIDVLGTISYLDFNCSGKTAYPSGGGNSEISNSSRRLRYRLGICRGPVSISISQQVPCR